MRSEMFDFIGNLDTLVAVVLGAVLATVGGVVASQIEYRAENRRRQRDSARFFGEVLSSADTILYGASESRKLGDPYGPVTMRMLRLARTELSVYERNRERLFDLPDPEMRARIHLHVLRQNLPLEGIIEATEEIVRIETDLKLLLDNDPTNDPKPERVEYLRARLKTQSDARERAFDLLNRVRLKRDEVLDPLKPIARVDFDAFAKAADV